MATHELKCWPDFWDAVADERKPFDIRKNDRGFQAGDILLLNRTMRDREARVEYDAKGNIVYQLRCQITYVLNGWGLKEDYVALGIKLLSAPSRLPTI